MDVVESTIVVACACDCCAEFVEPHERLCPACWAMCVHDRSAEWIELRERAKRDTAHATLRVRLEPDPDARAYTRIRSVAETVVETHIAAVDQFGALKTIAAEVGVGLLVTLQPEIKYALRASVRALTRAALKRQRKRLAKP